MKTLYEGILDDIKEGLLSDMETTLEKGTHEAKDLFERNFIKQNLFTDSWENRKKAINLLKEMVLRYSPTRVKTTAKIKNNNSIFVEFYFYLLKRVQLSVWNLPVTEEFFRQCDFCCSAGL